VIIAGIPAYNEEKTIAKVVLLTQKHVDKVIVCDDGSTDFTGDIAERLGAIVIRNEKNLGYGAAIQSLFEKARALDADVFLTLDGDDQHDPEEIPRMIKELESREADIVIGSRFLSADKNNIPTYRRYGVKLITKMSNGGNGNKVSDAQSGFRAYNKKAIYNLELLENGMGVSAEILMRARDEGLKITEVPATIRYKDLDTSTQNPLRHGLNLIVTILRLVVEERPLVYLGIPGTVLFLSGLVIGFNFYFNYIAGHFLPNDLFAAAFLILLGSLALMTAVNLYAIIRLSERQHGKEQLSRA
jgi:glycosyltransferase involved in cell wall biosynthesis